MPSAIHTQFICVAKPVDWLKVCIFPLTAHLRRKVTFKNSSVIDPLQTFSGLKKRAAVRQKWKFANNKNADIAIDKT